MVSNFPRTGSYAKYPGEYDEWFASTNSSITNLNGLYQQQLLQLQALQQPQPMPHHRMEPRIHVWIPKVAHRLQRGKSQE